MKVRELLKLLKQDGWLEKDQKGSHLQLIHPDKPGKSYSSGSWWRYS